MGMFSSLFGSSGSDKADKLRQQAIDAFNSIKTPELSQLQVQLQNYVEAGQLTPEQAESTLLNSNAFNDVKTDPSLVGAQKQALQQLQDISTKGGMDAISKAQLQDITNQQNADANGRNAAVMANANERGTGNSNLTTVNQLLNEQGAADRAAQSGTDVAANAQARALQAIQAAGGLGGQMEAQQYGEEANKAQSQNAIDLFNTQTRNATNLYNTQTANQAAAENLQNKQNVSNANTSTTNANKEYNANAVQQQYQDAMNKASGIAGVDQNWANQANSDANKEQAGNSALLGGLINAGAKAGGYALAGPAGGAATDALSASGNSTNPNYKMNPDGTYNFAEGGMVNDASDLEKDYSDFVKKYCYGGTVKMADGGVVHIKPSKTNNENKATPPLPITPNDQNPGEFQIKDPNGRPIGNFDHYADAAQYADKVREKQPNTGDFEKYFKGGEVVPTANGNQGDPDCDDEYRKSLSHAESYLPTLEEPENYANGGIPHDYRSGGKVPGMARVSGDSIKNDVVSAKLSPGELVIPRTVVQKPEHIPNFVNKTLGIDKTLHEEDPMSLALRKLRNPGK